MKNSFMNKLILLGVLTHIKVFSSVKYKLSSDIIYSSLLSTFIITLQNGYIF